MTLMLPARLVEPGQHVVFSGIACRVERVETGEALVRLECLAERGYRVTWKLAHDQEVELAELPA